MPKHRFTNITLCRMAVCATAIIVALWGVNGTPQAPTIFMSQNRDSGLLGEWKLCGDTSATSGCVASSSTMAYDSSGYGLNGTWSGTAGGTTGY